MIKEGKIINKGKTKVVYENLMYSNEVIIQFKDDITGGNGVKHDIMPGKAAIDNRTNTNIFEFLKKKKVPTHFVVPIDNTSFLAKKLSYKFPLKVVTRRVAYGSILKRSSIKAGDHFRIPLTEFYYKDYKLHDPKLDDAQKDPKGHFFNMRIMNGMVFLLLEKAMRSLKYQLVDLKLEYGIHVQNKKLIVIDEITAGSMRLWPFKKENPDFTKQNLLSELNPEGKLDKDLYREGKPLEVVKEAFEKLAKLTERL